MLAESAFQYSKQTLSQVSSIVASFAAVATLPAAFAFGLVPRLGPLRAIVLALSTRFRGTQVVSQRTNEVLNLRNKLSKLQKEHYVVVSGPNGIGKTCLVDTALQYTVGVVYVRVAAGTSEKEILKDAFSAITRSKISFLDYSDSARRVLWWHQFFFRQPATILLQAAERNSDGPFAAIHSTARALTHNYGARVLIDASDNSLPNEATATKRENLLEVEPMRRELLEQLPDLQLLLKVLKKADLDDIVWMCVGGNPADYNGLLGAWEEQNRQNIEKVVALFVQNLISKALNNVRRALISNGHLKGLFDKFRENSSEEVPSAILMEMKLVRPSPDKVLRAVMIRDSPGSHGSGRDILIPADAATALVLRTGITEIPSIEKLKAFTTASNGSAVKHFHIVIKTRPEPTSITNSQRGVSSTLTRLGYTPQLEVPVFNGLVTTDVVIEKPSSDGSSRVIKISIEFDGPTHYLRPAMGSRDRVGRIDARTSIRNALLKKCNEFDVLITIPYYEWDEVERGREEEEEYMKRKVMSE